MGWEGDMVMLMVFCAGPSHFVRDFQTVLDTPINGADEVAAEQPKLEKA